MTKRRRKWKNEIWKRTKTGDILLRKREWYFLLENHIAALPIDIFALAATCGYGVTTFIKYSEFTGEPLEKIIQKYNNKGFLFWSIWRKTFVVCYNGINPPYMERWIIMHEISHIELGHVQRDETALRARTFENVFMEIEADDFAMGILCPSIVLHDCGIIEADDIMKLCGIPRKEAEYRSDYMKMLEGRNEWRTDPLEVKVEKQFKPFIAKYLYNRDFCEFAMELTPDVVA